MALVTLNESGELYLAMVKESRSVGTFRAYKQAVTKLFQACLSHGVDLGGSVEGLQEECFTWALKEFRNYSAATESLYLQALRGYLNYIFAEGLTDINPERFACLCKQRGRRAGIRLPQFPSESIESVLAYITGSMITGAFTESERLLAYRDRAFILLLADCGLRVSEACKLRRGDIDWQEGKAIIIGKGDKQSVIRFSVRCVHALLAYLGARGKRGSCRAAGSLPVFVRLDLIEESSSFLTSESGRVLVRKRVKEALGHDQVRITPHSFRHYFVTKVLKSSNNLKLTQDLARHSSPNVTARYIHLTNHDLDQAYSKIFG